MDVSVLLIKKTKKQTNKKNPKAICYGLNCVFPLKNPHVEAQTPM
jgi:hypothetical protein